MSTPGRIRTLVLFLVLLLLAPAIARAEDAEWEYTIVPYILGASLNGDLTVRGQTTEVDLNLSDILENLEMGAMLHFEAKKGRWGIITDAGYLGLGATVEGNTTDADVDVDEFIAEADALFEVNKHFQVLFGARYVKVSADIDFKGLGLAVSGSRDWIDPVVGGRVIAPMGKSWDFMLRGDVGGFGVGSDFTWNAATNFGWKATEHFTLVLGYRWLDIDYEDGEGTDLFEYDILTQGPQIGFAFRY